MDSHKVIKQLSLQVLQQREELEKIQNQTGAVDKLLQEEENQDEQEEFYQQVFYRAQIM